MIVAGASNRPPMLDKTMYNSWKSHMFLYIKGKKDSRTMLESIENEYYLRFAQLINDMHTIGMTMQQVQVNTKFLNSLQPEWSKFVTDVKLAKNMYNTNFDQWYAYLSQHEEHANEARMMRERYPDPLALSQSFAGTGNKGNATSSRGNNVASQARVVKCYNCQGEGHMARQCTQPKRSRNSAWFKEKMLLVQAQESSQELDKEQLAFLEDHGVADGQATQTTISQNAAF
ncbi:retrovirus-related pol polyprotein from transposon TNT 1-94 [Tanacetum coccineum]